MSGYGHSDTDFKAVVPVPVAPSSVGQMIQRHSRQQRSGPQTSEDESVKRLVLFTDNGVSLTDYREQATAYQKVPPSLEESMSTSCSERHLCLTHKFRVNRSPCVTLYPPMIVHEFKYTPAGEESCLWNFIASGQCDWAADRVSVFGKDKSKVYLRAKAKDQQGYYPASILYHPTADWHTHSQMIGPFGNYCCVYTDTKTNEETTVSFSDARRYAKYAPLDGVPGEPLGNVQSTSTGQAMKVGLRFLSCLFIYQILTRRATMKSKSIFVEKEFVAALRAHCENQRGVSDEHPVLMTLLGRLEPGYDHIKDKLNREEIIKQFGLLRLYNLWTELLGDPLYKYDKDAQLDKCVLDDAKTKNPDYVPPTVFYHQRMARLCVAAPVFQETKKGYMPHTLARRWFDVRKGTERELQFDRDTTMEDVVNLFQSVDSAMAIVACHPQHWFDFEVKSVMYPRLMSLKLQEVVFYTFGCSGVSAGASSFLPCMPLLQECFPALLAKMSDEERQRHARGWRGKATVELVDDDGVVEGDEKNDMAEESIVPQSKPRALPAPDREDERDIGALLPQLFGDTDEKREKPKTSNGHDDDLEELDELVEQPPQEKDEEKKTPKKLTGKKRKSSRKRPGDGDDDEEHEGGEEEEDGDGRPSKRRRLQRPGRSSMKLSLVEVGDKDQPNDEQEPGQDGEEPCTLGQDPYA